MYMLMMICFWQIFHTICEIAEVLLALHQVGNTKYVGWYATVPCSFELIPELRKLYSSMQKELDDWKQVVQDARLQHYELNYFTTPQLLSLRQALGCYRTFSSPIDFQILALLRSISLQVTMQSIRDAVQRQAEISVTSRQVIEPQVQVIGSHEHATCEAGSLPSRIVPDMKRDKEKLPDPASQTSLTPKQKKILAKIVGMYGEYVKEYVHQAFEEGLDDQSDIENWLIEECIMGEDGQQEEEDDSSSEEESSVQLYANKSLKHVSPPGIQISLCCVTNIYTELSLLSF